MGALAQAATPSSCSTELTRTPVISSATDLPFSGVCPASELSCPMCPLETPVKCPSGLCAANVRECTPNVYIRGETPGATLAFHLLQPFVVQLVGDCNATHCAGIEFCHLHASLRYACWGASPTFPADTSLYHPPLAVVVCSYPPYMTGQWP